MRLRPTRWARACSTVLAALATVFLVAGCATADGPSRALADSAVDVGDMDGTDVATATDTATRGDGDASERQDSALDVLRDPADAVVDPHDVEETDDADGAADGRAADAGDRDVEPQDAGDIDVAADGADLDAAREDTFRTDTSDAPDDASPADAADIGGDGGDTVPVRIVVAGDSWSTGAVTPLLGALPDWGHADAEVRWEGTAIAGSQAREWVANHEGKLDVLAGALDGAPPADALLLFIGGNDFNFEMNEHGWSSRRRDATIDDIEADIERLVRWALSGRPGLTVVLVDYSYFNYLKIRLVYGFDFAPNLLDFNAAYVEMGARKRAIAARVDGCEYAHNFGILQSTLGDAERVYPFEPFVVPAYEPGFFPAPGHAPDYEPFPGGHPAFPAPDPAHFDGLHPTDASMRIILDNVFEQGLDNLLDGRGWLGAGD